MRDFFGKRSKSWHVSCVIEIEEESYSVQCFVHLFEECNQDWFTAASIIENLLETLKKEHHSFQKCFFAQTTVPGITTRPCCLFFQLLVQELGYVSKDTTFLNHRQRKPYATEG